MERGAPISGKNDSASHYRSLHPDGIIPPSAVAVAMLSKAEQSRIEYRGDKGELLSLGEIYLNDLSNIFMFEVTNLIAHKVKLQLRAELRKPFQSSQWYFQFENENVSVMQRELQQAKNCSVSSDEFNHVPFSVLRSSSKANLCAENVYLCDGYNELFNYVGTVNEILLLPNETKQIMFTLCTKLSPHQNAPVNLSYGVAEDSSEEERAHLCETSCFVLSGRLILQPSFVDGSAMGRVGLSEMLVPLQAQVCRSLLRLDVKELHFDDCIPKGSFVKDFTVWNRSEIQLLFKLVSPLTPWGDNNDVLVCTDYNSGYIIGNKTLQAAAYGHVRIRVTYRPMDVGEQFFEIQAHNLHDSRNVKTLKIHAVTNQEHHREGLSIKEPDGSYLMSGSRLDFGDCYTEIASSKIILLRNMTEVALHVELSSDRPKEVTFELKLQPNRSRVPRSPQPDEPLSHSYSNDGASSKGELSSDKTKSSVVFSNMESYGLESDEDVDENDDNEVEFYDDDTKQLKQTSFELDSEDIDDDFEFDRESRELPESPQNDSKLRVPRGDMDPRKNIYGSKATKSSMASPRMRGLTYDIGIDSLPSSPEQRLQAETKKRYITPVEDSSASNFLVEIIDLPPGVERTIIIWYSPAPIGSNLEDLCGETSEAVDLKATRLTKQTFRVSFRCFFMQGAWQQAQSRVYDRTLGKTIHIRARTCTSVVTVTPSILHLGDCNIGELRSSVCMLTNHSELPTVVKPLVTSKVISTVPNDDMILGPKQSAELKIEIIPRKTNQNYTRLISIINLKNKSNIPQICVRSSNMDAHLVIYHSLFYKLLTQSRSAFLNFEHVTANSVGIQVFDLDNITNAPLHLNIQSSAPLKVHLYCIRHPFSDLTNISNVCQVGNQPFFSSMNLQNSAGCGNPNTSSMQKYKPPLGRPIRRRRSFGSLSEISDGKVTSKKKKSLALRGLLTKKLTAVSAAQVGISPTTIPSLYSIPRSVSSQYLESDLGRHTQCSAGDTESKKKILLVTGDDKKRSPDISASGLSPELKTSRVNESPSEEVSALLQLFAKSRSECDAFCHSSIPSKEKEEEIVSLVRERLKRFQALCAEKKLIPLSFNKDYNLRIPAKARQRIVAVFSPIATETAIPKNVAKTRVEKHKILITLPPGGNKKAVANGDNLNLRRSVWAGSTHPFDMRASVRELLLKSRICRSIMNVNQKNINFGRIATSSKSSKRLIVQNMSATPLVYSVEKTGSISSGFLQIKEGEVGVVKTFGTKEIRFEFQPTLAGPFEEKLNIINVQDPANSVSVTIKAKVVKRETFKLLQSGQKIEFGKYLVGEKTKEVKIAIRNTSRKKREYVIQVDSIFTPPMLRPTIYFSVDETPAKVITQAEEKKLDEELEKLEHKLRIAVTKKKSDKIIKLNAKISHVKALLSGEQVAGEPEISGGSTPKMTTIPRGKNKEVGDFDPYDSANSDSESSGSELSSHSRWRRSNQFDHPVADAKSGFGSSRTNTLHFSLGAEATGRIVAYAIFNPLRSGDNSHHTDNDHKRRVYKSQRMEKRLLRRNTIPMVGSGKFLLFEQQNKDVVKELEYNAEIFLRTPAGETAFYRAVGRKPLSVLPPHPNAGEASSYDNSTEGRIRKAHESGGVVRHDDALSSLAALYGTDLSIMKHRRNLTVKIPDCRNTIQKLDLHIPDQYGVSPESSTLLVFAEESPINTRGWMVTLSLGSPSYKGSGIVEVKWTPTGNFKSVLALTCDFFRHNCCTPRAMSIATKSSEGADLRTMLPLKFKALPDRTINLKFKWCFTSNSGFASSTPLASCVGRSILENLSKSTELCAGQIDFLYHSSSSPQDNLDQTMPILLSSVGVAMAKGTHRSLYFEMETFDLGEHQLGEDVRSHLVFYNRSHQALQYVLLAGSRDQGSVSTSSFSPPYLVGGEMTFDNATGTIEAGCSVRATFVYRGSAPGQHTEQIFLRNLNGDRLDTSVAVISVRISRPVYVRVPELDPQSTGQLEILDLGPCYVTPEMQDTAVDSPFASCRFSKVHKLTLQSQVEDPLIICASSNLRTQCYVYEDARLHHEATRVYMKGKQSIDLYVAIRPRVSLDAIKSGSTRDLFGGIRVQLFGLQLNSDEQEEEKSDMVAEFTVKFVGIAGASIARVTPSIIDLGVEYNSGQLQMCQTHEASFELINLSKALPFRYRIFLTSATENYSDDDDSLHISLKHEKGEILPGETGLVEFRVMAYTNGLFRSRIMVENVHYPGKLSFVDVVLFVDSGILKCDVAAAAAEQMILHGQRFDMARESLQSVDIGCVNVIRLEDELTDGCAPFGGDHESASRKYRIYGEHSSGHFVEMESCRSVQLMSPPDAQLTSKNLMISNTTEQSIVVRPFSTLPLAVEWKGEVVEAISEKSDLVARSILVTSPKRSRTSFSPLCLQYYYGKPYVLRAKSSYLLSFGFADFATTPLLTDTVGNGKLCPFQGIIAIQSLESAKDTDFDEVCTLAAVNILGSYCEPLFDIEEKLFSLGKIGYGIGWKSSTFQICVKNMSDVSVPIVMSNIPPCLHVLDARGGNRLQLLDDAALDPMLHVPSLRLLALRAGKSTERRNTSGWAAWNIQPRDSCLLEMELVRTKESLTAGTHEFSLNFYNLSNPCNHENVLVRAQVISRYAELVIDPESLQDGREMTTIKEKHVAFLPPVTVPTPQESPRHRSSFWFSLRNVYDDELSVKILSQAHNSFDRTLELLVMLRSANTPLNSLVIAPGESVDIRVVCLVLPSARFLADTWPTGSNDTSLNMFDLGRIQLHINIHNVEDAAQREEIHVKGQLLPGKTLVLSADSLHFFATAIEIPPDLQIDQLPPPLRLKAGTMRESSSNTPPIASPRIIASVVHHLRNSNESFWVRNPSTLENLNFVISPVSMYLPGLCLVEGSTESEICAMVEWIQAIAVPSSGTVTPGESLKITVHLEEASMDLITTSLNMAPIRNSFEVGIADKEASMRKMRQWRSNSWDADGQEPVANEGGLNHMVLTVQDRDSNVDTGKSTEVRIALVLQQQRSVGDAAKQGGVVLDIPLIIAAFEARQKRLTQSRKLHLSPPLENHLKVDQNEQAKLSELDKFEEFDVSLIRSGLVGRKNHLPILSIRGCTPAEYSSLENTRYLIDAGQHTVRNGGEVEWEITIESIYSAVDLAIIESVEYRLMLVDKNARSWLQLSRERGTLDRAHSYQSVVLYFLRGVVGVYSTFLVLQNLVNPSDLKVIHVRLEVIADLNSLRGMSSGLDPGKNLFRVLVSNHSSPKRSRRSSIVIFPEKSVAGASRLNIDIGEVYYHKVYQNHSIMIENSSGLSLDFILSTNAKPQEVSFSASPMSLNEINTVTLGSHASIQVFLQFRPQPKQVVLPTLSSNVLSETQVNEPWVREIEVYVSCRLVKDFRETVFIRAICSQPQLMVDVANGEALDSPSRTDTYFSAQSPFLGLVFPMLESAISNLDLSTEAIDGMHKYLVVRNTRSDLQARLALRNDSVFFSVVIDETLSTPGASSIDLLDHGVCAGRRPTLLVTIQPQSAAVFQVKPDVAALRKFHQLWDQSIKEHVTLYNIKQFAEHYQVTLCFTCSSVASFYIPPNISESYPISALEDVVAKFLQNYEHTWKWLMSYYEKTLVATMRSTSQSSLVEVLNKFENALDLVSPLSPRNLVPAATKVFDEAEGVEMTPSRDDLHQLVQSYRALYFDFYYITDELVWYGVRGNAVRHSLALADLAYGVVFNHEVFRSFLSVVGIENDAVALPRLLLPWVCQLEHFLSFFPDNQEATQPLRLIYDQLRKFEAN
ncbi:uncharacterized protein CCR75_008852 [Bremia lactucae]|uniref:HYDIN/VesB/CFA65-like Ig-like domain-containing protein n=1 Tax=Bremia lactucae TaxID=4779 RepID=A0A976FDK3_BRELC|nr:hypothetical protein CCR75_008852 [Bremia lactucae]